MVIHGMQSSCLWSVGFIGVGHHNLWCIRHLGELPEECPGVSFPKIVNIYSNSYLLFYPL